MTDKNTKPAVIDKFGSTLSPERSEIFQRVISLGPDGIKSLTADLKHLISEDYTAQKIEASVVDEIPAVITTLTDLVETDEKGDLLVRKDERGNWIDFIGAKGNIPRWFMPFNQRANFSSIFLRLEHGCYEVEYKINQDGSLYLDENNNPVIQSKKCTSMAVSLRNLNQVCMLALEANRPILQAKIFGGLKGGVPLGYEGNFDKIVLDLMGKPRK